MALEQSDAAWIEPSEELIMAWDSAWLINKRRYGRYNRDTGFFEGNGKLDITTEQAIRILEIGYIRLAVGGCLYIKPSLPTILPVTGDTSLNLNGTMSCVSIDTIRIIDYYVANNNENPDTHLMRVPNSRGFASPSSIREIKGILNMQYDTAQAHFYQGLGGGSILETLWLYHIIKDVDLSRFPAFRLECISYMIEHAANTTPITITLHPDAYARVTDDIIAAATAKQITIAST